MSVCLSCHSPTRVPPTISLGLKDPTAMKVLGIQTQRLMPEPTALTQPSPQPLLHSEALSALSCEVLALCLANSRCSVMVVEKAKVGL